MAFLCCGRWRAKLWPTATSSRWRMLIASRHTLIFHFKDGSLHDETAVYSQLRSFRLVRYHLLQKGPSFSSPKDVSIDVLSGQVTVRYTGDDGKEQVKTEPMKLFPDLANGMIFTLLKNMPFGNGEMKASMVVTTPKPRVVRLAISAQGEDTFMLGGDKRKATHYIVKRDRGPHRSSGAAAGKASSGHPRLDSAR
jgi:hypothetical protein